jgi:hypothetical protein
MTSSNEGPADQLSRLPLTGLDASWTFVAQSGDPTDREELSIGYENEAWTVQGIVSGIDIHYVIRLTALWKVQQMLLFRDLEEPDLWLANDGKGRWGEVNGSERRELTRCEDIDVRCSAFTRTLAIRRLVLDVGESRLVRTVVIDPDSLAISQAQLTYTRLARRSWLVERDDDLPAHRFDTDEFGLPLDIPGTFTRTR